MATFSNLELPQVKIKLYGTTFCHLCKEAETIIHTAGIAAIHIDIAEDDDLFEKYSARIPVLRRVDNDAELGWPFDAAAVLRFLI
jgi:glutaredoxin